MPANLCPKGICGAKPGAPAPGPDELQTQAEASSEAPAVVSAAAAAAGDAMTADPTAQVCWPPCLKHRPGSFLDLQYRFIVNSVCVPHHPGIRVTKITGDGLRVAVHAAL